MKFKVLALTLAFVSFAGLHAQGTPTATQLLQLSAFAGGTGTFTGLLSGKNLGITAGIDLGAGSFHGFHPSLEVRGTYPVYDGSLDSQKNVLGGIRIDHYFGRLRPYVDFLYGRGEITYQGLGYPSPNGLYYYTLTPSNVYAPGAGVDLTLSRSFAIKLDGQFEHYNTPVTTSGGLYAKAVTLGLVYRVHLKDKRRGPLQ